MSILTTSMQTRPKLACEIRPEGVVAARCQDDAVGIMSAISVCGLAEGAFRPGLHPGNLVDRRFVVESMRQALEKVFERKRELTLIVPDASVRVLLLEFEALPNKPEEALQVIRFRLKKLLPFEADDAGLSYQVMSTTRTLVRVVAVAMPNELIHEYESAVREAGFEPGAILPSTLAVLAGLEESDAPALLANVSPEGVTAAIVRSGVVLLHRSVDMRVEPSFKRKIDPENSVVATIPNELLAAPVAMSQVGFGEGLLHAAGETESLTRLRKADVASLESPAAHHREQAVSLSSAELVQAVSVAAAYFEDTLGSPPPVLLAAGVTGSAELTRMLEGSSLAGLKVREMIDATMIPAGQRETVPRGWLAGVRGALRS